MSSTATPPIPRFAIAAALLPCLGMLLNTWPAMQKPGKFEFIFPVATYLINVALMLCCAFGLLFLGFVAYRSRWTRTSQLALFAATACVLLGISDCYIILFRYDTSGPGGPDCFTHMNWSRRFMHSNKAGYWEREFDGVENKAARKGPLVAAVGGSFVWGQGILGREWRFTDQLQSILQKKNAGASVLNFGKPGATMNDWRKGIVPDVAKLNPDVVVVFYTVNSTHDNVSLALVDESVQPMDSWLIPPLRLSPTFNFLYWRMYGASRFGRRGVNANFGIITALRDADNFREHMRDVQLMVDSVKALTPKVLWVVMPYPHLWVDIHKKPHADIVNKVVEGIKATGIPVLNLLPLEEKFPPGGFEISANDAHPNNAVHQAIADGVGAWLIENNYLR